jgi:hypothetical protein
MSVVVSERAWDLRLIDSGGGHVFIHYRGGRYCRTV